MANNEKYLTDLDELRAIEAEAKRTGVPVNDLIDARYPGLDDGRDHLEGLDQLGEPTGPGLDELRGMLMDQAGVPETEYAPLVEQVEAKVVEQDTQRVADMITAAKDRAAAGHAVVPAGPDRQPLGDLSFEDATTDVARIDEWAEVGLWDDAWGFLASEQPQTKPRFRFLSAADLEAMEPPEWIVDRHLPERSLVVLYGPPGAGKSFLALDVALSMACSVTSVLGSTKPGPVVYVAPEGSAGLGERIRAWRKAHGISHIPAAQFLAETVDLRSKSAVSDFIAQCQPMNPRLVVIDTLARSLPGGDENSATDMGLVIAASEAIQRRVGATVMLVHHVNASGERERGSTALRGAADTMAKLDSGQLTCDKQKDATPFPPRQLVIRPVEDTQSAIVAEGAYSGALEGLRLEALRTLHESFFDTDGASFSAWREACPTLKEGSASRTFKSLVEGGYVDCQGEGRARRYYITDLGREAIDKAKNPALESWSES